jgi:hypothetical protein
VKSREEILGEALRQEEIKELVDGCLNGKYIYIYIYIYIYERRMLNVAWCGGRERWFAA